jgi:hypothetical protein
VRLTGPATYSTPETRPSAAETLASSDRGVRPCSRLAPVLISDCGSSKQAPTPRSRVVRSRSLATRADRQPRGPRRSPDTSGRESPSRSGCRQRSQTATRCRPRFPCHASRCGRLRGLGRQRSGMSPLDLEQVERLVKLLVQLSYARPQSPPERRSRARRPRLGSWSRSSRRNWMPPRIACLTSSRSSLAAAVSSRRPPKRAVSIGSANQK